MKFILMQFLFIFILTTSYCLAQVVVKPKVEVNTSEDSIRLFLTSSYSGDNYYVAFNIKTPYQSGRIVGGADAISYLYRKIGAPYDRENGMYSYLSPYLFTNDTFDIRKFPKSKNRKFYQSPGIIFVKNHREVDSVASLGVDSFLQHFFYIYNDSTHRYREYKYEMEKGLTFNEKNKRRKAVINQLFNWGILVCNIQSGELRFVTKDEAMSSLKNRQAIRERNKPSDDDSKRKK